jgi:hypothetical protein
MRMVLAASELSDILDVVWEATVAGIVVVVLFSFGILGMTRADDARRAGRGARAAVHLAGGTLALVLFAGAVGYGVHVMLST